MSIDRVEEGLETEVIHVMFYNEVYVVALGLPQKPGKLIVSKAYILELPPLLNHMPPDSRYQLETVKENIISIVVK